MAMKGIHKAQPDMASHSGQPSGKKLFTETNNADRTSGYGNAIAKNHPEKGGQGKLKEGNLTANAGQPSGKGIGYKTGSQGSDVKAVPGVYSNLNSRGVFGNVKGAKGADCFRSAGHSKDGVLRTSGVSGAHRLGSRKK